MLSQCRAMVLINLGHVTCLLSLIHLSCCQRRIQGGADVDKDKIYAVYLLKAAVSPMRYIGWVCGGAIVTEWYIVTSAACVQDVKHLYAIAGYKKYVRANDVDTDQCTKRTKKKVVFTCVPKSYNFEYLKIEKWAHIDIAVVKVESKYDFTDKTYLEFCSYIPGPIDINYDGKYQNPGTDTIVLGWGHNKHFRQEKDINIYNEKDMKYAPLLIVPKSICKNAYSGHGNLTTTIDRYMICAYGAGNLDDTGGILNTGIPKVDGCVTEEQQKLGLRGSPCNGEIEDKVDLYEDAYKADDYDVDNISRRHIPETDLIIDEELKPKEKPTPNLVKEHHIKLRRSDTMVRTATKEPTNDYFTYQPARQGEEENNGDDKTTEEVPPQVSKEKSEQKGVTIPDKTTEATVKKEKKAFNSSLVGICQNDHGGPLVTWVGAKEVLIGVATAFIVSESSQCIGPYLFTSTQCNSAFLDCLINNARHTSTKLKLCNNPQEIGFEMIRRYISWADHPSGPAKNEIVETRPQISIQKYHNGNAEVSHCRRRIRGAEVTDDKRYAVYLVKAVPNGNRDWLCGGAIVTEWYIVTSAACVQKIQFMYAVAGYKKFVNANDLENDECTKRHKKKIVFSCVPKSYDFDHERMEKWSHIDIAVIKVESKYNFNDKSYLEFCSYIPGPIHINFDPKYQQPGTDSIALGWGHSDKFLFKNTDTINYNQNNLKYTPLLLVPTSVCKEAYTYYENKVNIDKYMICAQGVGNIDDMGGKINKDVSKVDGCVTENEKLKGLRGVLCEVDNINYDDLYQSNDYKDENKTRRDFPESNVTTEKIYDNKYYATESQQLDLTTREPYLSRRPTNMTNYRSNEKRIPDYKNNRSSNGEFKNDSKKSGFDNKSFEQMDDKLDGNYSQTDDRDSMRRKISFNSSNVGICQNDHGGPLVAWVGAREVLIGVITTFILSSESVCKGPYLFTSTYCSSKFLDCFINYSTKTDETRRLCDSPREIGFEMKRRYISWADYPSKSVENDSLIGRQLSIQKYYLEGQKTLRNN